MAPNDSFLLITKFFAVPYNYYEGFNTIFFENFEFFSDSFSITISYPKILIPFIWRKPVSCRRVTLPAERKKKHWPQPAFAHALIVSPWLCEPFTDTDRIWSRRSDRNVSFHLTKLFSSGPMICILLTSTITKLAVALVWSLQLECTFHWARGFSEISNRNFCSMESA